jgi:hypothetical protein
VDAVDHADDRILHLDDDRELIGRSGPDGHNLGVTVPYGGAA